MFGLYKHYKGGYYFVIGVGTYSEDLNNKMVIYLSLSKWSLWLRPYEMFCGQVSLSPKINWLCNKCQVVTHSTKECECTCYHGSSDDLNPCPYHYYEQSKVTRPPEKTIPRFKKIIGL
jgi:hypothetical protein